MHRCSTVLPLVEVSCIPGVYESVLQQPNISVASPFWKTRGSQQQTGDGSGGAVSGTATTIHSSDGEPIDSVVYVTIDASPDEVQNGHLTEAVVDAMVTAPNELDGSYHTFFTNRRAAFLYEDDDALKPSSIGTGACRNMRKNFQLDVVYTYVREDAPSHIKNRQNLGWAMEFERIEVSRLERVASLRSVFNYHARQQ